MKSIYFFKTSVLLTLLTFVLGLASCSQNSDDEDYQSVPPRFENVEVSNADNPGGELKAGENIKITAIQKEAGRLLIGSTYTWSVSPQLDVEYEPVKNVNYGVDSSNPTNIFKFANPGTYRITLKAKYTTSGSKGMTEGWSENHPDQKFNISYEVYGAAFFYYLVTIDKYVTIK